MPDFLLEIGCEEIPARMLLDAEQELVWRITRLLGNERLKYGSVNPFSTPRRVAAQVADVAASQPDLTEQLTGPSVNVAYKDGQPTPAAHAFARKAGVDVSHLEKIDRKSTRLNSSHLGISY